MNGVLNHGFASPYIEFHFATGSIEPFNFPPTYFMSLVNKRTVDAACTFTLTLVYAPGNFGESYANLIHQLLLTSKNQRVTYRYGYVTPGGGLRLQTQCYSGIFTTYTENINEGYLTYVIEGVAEVVEDSNLPVNIETFMQRKKTNRTYWGAGREYTIYADTKVKPSELVRELVTIDTTSGIREYFEDYDIVIDHTDMLVDVNTINIDNGCLHDVFFGKANGDGTTSPSGFVDYSVTMRGKDNSVLSDDQIAHFIGYETLIAHGASSDITEVMRQDYGNVSVLNMVPFICYYDNVIPAINSPKKGTFYYVPKENRQANSIYHYNFGNSYIDSDVIDLSVEYDGTKAVATVPALESVDVDIDLNGELVGSNYNVLQNDGFVRQSYNTLSGFNEALFLTESVIADSLNYPNKATLKIMGQAGQDASDSDRGQSRLLDVIRLEVTFNGVKHMGVSGDYQILGIEDELSTDGFYTSLDLVRYDPAKKQSELPLAVGTPQDASSQAYLNEQKRTTATN